MMIFYPDPNAPCSLSVRGILAEEGENDGDHGPRNPSNIPIAKVNIELKKNERLGDGYPVQQPLN